jgi:hypothetical protein
MLLGQFHRRCLAVNLGCSAFCLHQRRATFSDPVFVVGGESGAAIHQRLSAQYGNSVLPQRSVYEWIEKFKNDLPTYTVILINQ